MWNVGLQSKFKDSRRENSQNPKQLRMVIEVRIGNGRTITGVGMNLNLKPIDKLVCMWKIAACDGPNLAIPNKVKKS